MRVTKRNRTWIPGIVFWLLFLVSLAFAERYPWLDQTWYAAGMVFLLVVAIYSIMQIFRKRQESGGFVGYRGAPL